jgi:hypothetical protein
MPDLFSQFGAQPQANPYMWPPTQGAFGWGKQGLMGAAGPFDQRSGGELPAQAQGQGIPGGFTPPTPPQMPPPDMSALGATPQPQQLPPPITPPTASEGAGPPGLQLGLSGVPQSPTVEGQMPMPGVPGGSISAGATFNPADYKRMIAQAQGAARFPF